MSRIGKTLAPFGPLVKVLAILWLVDRWVAGPFFHGYVDPFYVTPFPLLRDRTFGNAVVILADAMERIPREKMRVALVGDSTMNGLLADDTEIPFLLGPELKKQVPQINLETIEAGLVGLYCSDALLWIDKLLGDRTNVIVYGITLRAFPRQPESQWVTRMSSEMSARELARLISVGGTRWLRENLTTAETAAGLIFSQWRFYAYRWSLRRYFWEVSFGRAIAADSDLAKIVGSGPPAPRPAIAPPVRRSSVYEWSQEDYGFGNPNWEALELVGALCRRYAPGRCVIYAGPVNPLDREHIVDPAFYEAYVATLRRVAGRYGLVWRDYTDALTPAEFRPDFYGRQRDPMHPNEAGRAKIAALLAEPVAQALRCAAGRGPCLVE